MQERRMNRESVQVVPNEKNCERNWKILTIHIFSSGYFRKVWQILGALLFFHNCVNKVLYFSFNLEIVVRRAVFSRASILFFERGKSQDPAPTKQSKKI